MSMFRRLALANVLVQAAATAVQDCSVGANCTDRPGTYCNGVILKCLDTPEGRVANADSVGFSKCPAGTLAPGLNSPRCDECPTGKWTSEEGRSLLARP
eukprot:TRINITY_DN29148_c1_g3_i3.p1 TRINITY_DN29148_c1_g3~~TRINITY_DN29148_c1_g3_i3.p1  ORF type:complete len:112 (+),score=1.26 TRINITY_DN29148_c1_g3_i3:40-336(+)